LPFPLMPAMTIRRATGRSLASGPQTDPNRREAPLAPSGSLHDVRVANRRSSCSAPGPSSAISTPKGPGAQAEDTRGCAAVPLSPSETPSRPAPSSRSTFPNSGKHGGAAAAGNRAATTSASRSEPARLRSLRVSVLEEGRDCPRRSCDNDDRPQLKRDVKRSAGRSDRILYLGGNR